MGQRLCRASSRTGSAHRLRGSRTWPGSLEPLVLQPTALIRDDELSVESFLDQDPLGPAGLEDLVERAPMHHRPVVANAARRLDR